MSAGKKDKYRFYVYFHRYSSGPKSGQVFYIGKGTGTRAYSNTSRNKHWHAVNNKYGRVTEIYKSKLSSDQASSLEVEKIKEFGLENLCNKSTGGDAGAIGVVHSPEFRKKISEMMKKRAEKQKNDHRFVHPCSGRVLSEESREKISNSLRLYWSMASRSEKKKRSEKIKKSLSRKSSIAKRKEQNTAEKNPMFDSREWKFTHVSGDVFFGTQYDFVKLYKLNKGNVSSMVNGKRKSVSGWRCENVDS